MVVRSNSKSSTAPPPYSSLSQTSTSTTASTINRQADAYDNYSKMRVMDMKNKKDIARSLANDRSVIKNARDAVAKQHGFQQLHEQEQERRMREAALKRVQARIDSGQYTSCTYPEFIDYVPNVAFGAVSYSKDLDKEERTVRQLTALRKKCDGRQLNSGDYDDEDPLPIKTEGNTTKRKMSDFFPSIEKNGTRFSKDATNPGRVDSANEEDNNGSKTATAGRRSQGRNTTAHTSDRSRVDKSHYKNNKKESITWRAVSRGEPLTPGSPAPTFKQWNPARNPWLGRVVFRGQIMAEDGKGKD